MDILPALPLLENRRKTTTMAKDAAPLDERKRKFLSYANRHVRYLGVSWLGLGVFSLSPAQPLGRGAG